MISKATRLHSVEEYYFSKKLREVRQLKAEGRPIINVGIGSPDMQPPEAVVKALQNSLMSPSIHGYQSYQGIPELRDAIGTFYQKNYGVKLDARTEILPLMGSKEGILHISMAFLNAGDEVLIPNPGYPTYSSVTKLVEATPVYYKLSESGNWFPDLEALAKKDLTNVKMMWINYPHMPTGTKVTMEQFKRLIAFAKKHQLLLINDNPYSFVLNKDPQSVLAIPGAKDVAIELNSLSKSFNMAGWRVGMVLGSEKTIKTILQVKSNMDSGMFFGIQKGAIAALNMPQNWFSTMNTVYSKRREIAWQIYDILGCTYDKNSVGLFVWGKIQTEQKSEALTDKLLYEYDVFLTPGTVFGSNGEGYIRLSLCTPVEELKEVLKRVSN